MSIRGPYRTRTVLPQTDEETAEHLARSIASDLKSPLTHGALHVFFYGSKLTIQKLVIEKLRPAKHIGAPKRAFPDHIWLEEVEGVRKEEKLSSDRQAIVRLLKGGARHQRNPGVPFKQDTQDGKAEIRRVQDALVRERKKRKSK